MHSAKPPYVVHVDFDKRIITAKYSGSITIYDRKAVVGEVMEKLKAQPDFGVLIDMTDAIDTLSEAEHMAFGEFLAERAAAYFETRVAVLNPNNEQQLAVSVAYSGGFHNLVQFNNLKDALNWLKHRN